MIDIVRVLAPNPGPFTGPGTNTYVLAVAGQSLILDPGPVIPSHLTAITASLAGTEPVAVVVTHTHPDHAPAANPLGAELGVPVLGFAPGPEFTPDRLLRDGDTVSIGDEWLRAVHTPGHTPDHLCFATPDGTLFTGDHIMGGSTVIIEDAADYLASLHKLRAMDPHVLQPGHGDRMDDPAAVIDDYIAHRIERERQIVAAVEGGAASPEEIVDAVYAGIAAALRPAAVAQVLVQLRKLGAEGKVSLVTGDAGYGARIEPAGEAHS